MNQAARQGLQRLAPNMIPEYERVVAEAAPLWFLMENVKAAPVPAVDGYIVESMLLNNRWIGAEQNRLRRFSFGTRTGDRLVVDDDIVLFENPQFANCFTANGTQWVSVPDHPNGKGGHSRGDRSEKSLKKGLRLQGLPDGFLQDSPLTIEGKVRVIGNGVPLPMGRVIARAVKRAIKR